jgi:hypothetical protein
VNGRLLRRRRLPGTQTRLYNHLVPFLRMEEWFESRFAMSVFAVAENPAPHRTS